MSNYGRLVLSCGYSLAVGLCAGKLARLFHATDDQALWIYFLVVLVMIPHAYRSFR